VPGPQTGLFVEALLDVSPVAHAGTAVVLYGLTIGCVALVPLLRADLPRERVRRVVRDWVVSAAAHLTVLVGLTWLVTRLVGRRADGPVPACRMRLPGRGSGGRWFLYVTRVVRTT
jgi:hypothetical protein